jgi:ribosomal protein S18 acetylase RimI-like enzyme
MEARRFSPRTRLDAARVVNAYIAGWPYSRPIGEGLLRNWEKTGRIQPDNMWICYRDGNPAAFLHGEHRDMETAVAYMLAVVPGAEREAGWLLAEFEASARAAGMRRLIGPNHSGGAFYGGYVLGLEPFHPHWSTAVTDLFLRAGFRITNPAVMLSRRLDAAVRVECPPAGYEIARLAPGEEFEAVAFGYHAMFRGEEVARCCARLYPHLESPCGGIVGQIGPVRTDEEHRGRGLARIMTTMCARDLRAMGASEALVTTSLENFPALRAYERAGFSRKHFLMEWSKTLQ